MTKKLEELLNLPESKKIVKTDEKVQAKADAAPFLRDMAEFDKISAALPAVKGLGDATDAEFDALAQRATDAYDDLIDLGMNVEARYSSRIFEVAASMLKNAIDAKSAKIDKKLKAVDLQLKKLKIDNDSGADPNDVINGQGYVITDRNELLKKLGQKD